MARHDEDCPAAKATTVEEIEAAMARAGDKSVQVATDGSIYIPGFECSPSCGLAELKEKAEEYDEIKAVNTKYDAAVKELHEQLDALREERGEWRTKFHLAEEWRRKWRDENDALHERLLEAKEALTKKVLRYEVTLREVEMSASATLALFDAARSESPEDKREKEGA